MKKAWFLIITGLTLLGLGSTGLALFHLEMQRREDESKAAAVSEAQRLEEQHNLVEELKEQLDEERSAALEMRFRLLAEKRGREEEEAKHRREIQALSTRVDSQMPRKGSRRSASLAEPADEAGAKPPQPSPGSVTLSVELDPLKSPEVRVAHVHAGDKVYIRARRPARGAGGIYVGLSPLDFMAAVSPRGLQPPWAAPPSPVVLAVKEKDSFRLSPPASLDPEMVRTVSTREGAIMSIGVGAPGRGAARFQGRSVRGGVYEIDVTIETANRWAIPPRSLL